MGQNTDKHAHYISDMVPCVQTDTVPIALEGSEFKFNRADQSHCEANLFMQVKISLPRLSVCST